MKREAAFMIEAPDYPYDEARRVLDLLPDEWFAVVAKPLTLHPEPCDSGCPGDDCEVGVYSFGQDGWAFYDGEEVGSRYVGVVIPVADMLDDDIRRRTLDKVRYAFAAPPRVPA